VETSIHLCVGAKGTRNSTIYASSKLDMLIMIWNGQAAKRASVLVCHILCRAFVASMQAKQLQPQSLFDAAHCDDKTREQHALTLDGGSRGLPPLALSMVQLEDGLPV